VTGADLQRLLAQGQIERVAPDIETAREEIATARTHLAAVSKIAELDPTLAFTGLYDAMRKAIQGHMRARLPSYSRPGRSRQDGGVCACSNGRARH
jgi:hypothetical protein